MNMLILLSILIVKTHYTFKMFNVAQFVDECLTLDDTSATSLLAPQLTYTSLHFFSIFIFFCFNKEGREIKKFRF